MSMIDTRHNVVPFDAKTSKAFGDNRLAKVGYKSSKTNPAKFPSVCASIPVLSNWTEQESNSLRPYIVQMVQDTQDKIIRSLYESSDGTLTSVSDADICMAQVIGYLQSESAGDRLTKDRIVAWFDESLRDNLTVVICEKLGTDNLDDVRVIQHLAGYRGLFGSLSKDSGAMNDTQIRALRKALEITAADDDTSKRLDSKLESMMNRPKMEELLEL